MKKWIIPIVLAWMIMAGVNIYSFLRIEYYRGVNDTLHMVQDIFDGSTVHDAIEKHDKYGRIE